MLSAAWPALRALAEGAPSREVCGLLVRPPGGEVEVWPLTNAALDPGRAFAVAPVELLAALRRLDAAGGELLAVFHSHPFGGATLSAEDLRQAVIDGIPVLPGVAQVVVALEQGRAVEVRVHRWTDDHYEGSTGWRLEESARGPSH